MTYVSLKSHKLEMLCILHLVFLIQIKFYADFDFERFVPFLHQYSTEEKQHNAVTIDTWPMTEGAEACMLMYNLNSAKCSLMTFEHIVAFVFYLMNPCHTAGN